MIKQFLTSTLGPLGQLPATVPHHKDRFLHVNHPLNILGDMLTHARNVHRLDNAAATWRRDRLWHILLHEQSTLSYQSLYVTLARLPNSHVFVTGK
jgi:hypothetical protein